MRKPTFLAHSPSAEFMLDRRYGSDPTQALILLRDTFFRAFMDNGGTGFALTDYTRVAAPPAPDMVSTPGFGQVGRWYRQKRRPDKFENSVKLFVYWPHIIQQAYGLMLLNAPMAFFLSTFREVIRRRSPYLWEALHRKYVSDLHTIAHEYGTELEQSVDSRVNLAHTEEERVQDMLDALSCDQEFIGVLQRVSVYLYSEFTLMQARNKVKSMKGQLDRKYSKHCSVIYLCSRKGCARKPTLDDAFELNDNLYSRTLELPLIDDLFIANDVATRWKKDREAIERYVENAVSRLGVMQVKYKGRSTLIINWRLWYAERFRLGKCQALITPIEAMGIFKEARASRKPPEYHPLVATLYNHRFPKLITYISVHDHDFRTNRLARYWDSTDITDDNILAIDVEALVKHRAIESRKAKTRGGVKVKPQYKAPEVNPLPYVFTINTETQNFKCTAVHTGRKLWFIPPWPMSNALLMRKECKRNNFTPTRHAEGVTYIEGYGLAYTATFLTNPEKSPDTPEIEGIAEALFDVEKRMTRAAVRAIQFETGDNTTPNKQGCRFTPEEDLAIELNFRPGMTVEQRMKIKEACPTRSKVAISTQARRIRQRLIAKGVYDKDLLPHGSYNHRIGLEIKAAKEAQAQED